MLYGTQQEWLTDMEISYTEGPMNLNWKQIMQTVEGDERFYMDTEEDEVTAKEAGWEFLRMNGKDDEVDEESEEESVYSEASDPEEEVSSDLNFVYLLLIDHGLTLVLSYISLRRNPRKRILTTTTTTMMTSQILMVTTILKSKVWIGTIWRKRQLQMIARKNGMARRLKKPGLRKEGLVIRQRS